jgi:hypothetical protein
MYGGDCGSRTDKHNHAALFNAVKLTISVYAYVWG